MCRKISLPASKHSLLRISFKLSLVILPLSLILSVIIIAQARPHTARAAGPTLQVFPNSQQYFSQTKLRVQGTNYPSGQSVKVYWNYTHANNTGILEFMSMTDSRGAFSGSFLLPLTSTNTYTIAGVDQRSNVVATTTFQLLPNLFALPRATGIGSAFTLTGQAFGAGETVDLYWNCTSNCTGTPFLSVPTDTTGSFQVTAHVPANATYGKNVFLGLGRSSNASSLAKIIVYKPTLTLAPLNGSAGTPLSLSAYGFQSKEKVSAYWNNGSTAIFSTRTTANGYVPITVYSVPAGNAPGNYPITIVGTTSHLTLTGTFTVVPANANLSTTSGPVGTRVRVAGQGYEPNETVNVFWNYQGPGTGKKVATMQVGSTGAFQVSFLVPANGTFLGAYPVAIIGATSNRSTTIRFTMTTGLAASPSTSAPGTPITLVGTGFTANEVVNFSWDSAFHLPLASAIADANGNVSASLTFPASATPGSHTVFAVGQASGTSFTTPVTVETEWTDFGFGLTHLRNNPFENSVSPANVGNLHLKWSAPIGSQPEGAPSPVYYNGTVYIATLHGTLDAYNASTGNLRWQFDTGTTFANLSSPVIDPTTNTVFFGTLGFLEEQDHGVPSPFFALDAQSGQLLWSVIIPSDDYAFPTLAFNTIFVGISNEGGGSLLAIDETSGSVLWQFKANGGVWGAVGVDSKTNTIFTGSGNPGDQVFALNPATGAVKWQHTIVSPGHDDDIGAAMAVANGMVYVDSKNGYMYALNESDGTQVWQTRIGANSIGNVSSPAVDTANGFVYVGSLNNYLYALNATTGVILWRTQTGGQVFSSPALANGVVYFASNDGKFYAVDATTGARLWSYATQGPTFSSPVLVNGWLYCASTDGNLYAFSL